MRHDPPPPNRNHVRSVPLFGPFARNFFEFLVWTFIRIDIRKSEETTMNEVWEALESTTPGGKINDRFGPSTASRQETMLWKRSLLNFLDEVDGELSVAELREALMEYK